MNFKPIGEVPEVQALAEGDKLLVNSGGMAKQIDASKVGGSGGGSAPVYVQLGAELTEPVMAYKDEAFTQPMTYDEGVAALLGGSMWVAEYIGEWMVSGLIAGVPNAGAKMLMVMPGFMMAMGEGEMLTVVFSDTAA